MKKIIAAIVTALVAVGLVVVGVAAPASAHTATLSGSAACNTTDGSAVVTWTIDNDYDEAVSVTSSDNAAIPANSAASTLPATGTNGGKDTIKTFTQNIAAPAAGVSVSATLSFDWAGDDFKQGPTTATAQVSGDCVAPTPKDASAVLIDTKASCASAEVVSEGAVSNASWNGPIVYSGPNNTTYTAIATADNGHHFPDAPNVTDGGKTITFTATLNPKQTAGCTSPPPCLDNSHVSYTYSHNDANTGVITVTDATGSSHVLCHPFYVTATSWTYTNGASIWPQKVDVVDQVSQGAPISAPGTYDYAALVTCGQGDIYASTDATAPSLNPAHYSKNPGELLGSNNPFPEHFLSDMGFTQSGSSGATYTNDANSCWKGTPETGSPTSSVATCTVGGPTNTLILPAVPGGVWTIKGDGYTHSYAIGTGASVSDANLPNGFEKYTVSLADGDSTDGYNVTSADSPWPWTPVDTTTCPVYKPTVTDVVGECSAIAGPSTETVTLLFDNTQSTGASKFVVGGENLEQEVPAGGSATQVVTSAGTNGATYDIYINDSPTPVVITVPPFEGCAQVSPGTPLVVQQVCTAGVVTEGSVSEAVNTDIAYTLTGTAGSVTPTTTTDLTTFGSLDAGSYTLTATPATGFLFPDTAPAPWTATTTAGVTSWTQTIQIADITCTVDHYTAAAGFDPATCSSSRTDPVEVDGNLTFVWNPNVQYFINDSTTPVTPSSPVATGAVYSLPAADGTYNIVAKLTPAALAAGDKLDGTTSWSYELGPVLCLPTEAAFHAAANGTDATCTDGTALGTIHLGHLASEAGKVYYVIKNDATGHVITTKASTASVQVPPGVYTVTAKPVKRSDGISGQSVFDITIAAATAICGSSNTLAFTGGTIGTLGIFIAGGMLFLGLAAIYMRRRFGRTAE